MSNNTDHFIGPLCPVKKCTVKGYGVMDKVRGEGTIKWKIEGNDGKLHNIIIHKVN